MAVAYPVAGPAQAVGRPGASPAFEIGRDALLENMRVFFADRQATDHAITNHRISIDGDVATIRAHVQAQHWLPADRAPQHCDRATTPA